MQENMLNDQRRMWKYILFGVLTCGIYDFIFMWYMFNDLNRACGYMETDEEDRSPNYLVFLLLTFITCGIYSYVWYYKQGNRVKRIGKAYGLEIDEKGSTYVLWILCGVFLFGIGPFVAIYLFISNMNRLCRVYNQRIAEAPGQDPFGSSPDPAPAGGNYGGGNYGGGNYGGNNYGGYGGGYGNGGNAPTIGAVTGKLLCTRGSYSGAEIDLPAGQELVIGRNSSMSQLVLPDQDISRKHCSIRYSSEDGGYYVTDYSTYGVYINDGQRMEKGVSVRCSAGTKLSLGNGNNVFILK